MKVNDLKSVFSAIHGLELVVLVGSQSNGTAHADSDWDFAIQWNREMSFMDQLSTTEKLRKHIATSLKTDLSEIDLIDLPSARLAMKALVAEEGVILHGVETLAWCHFLQRTWRELEEQYWEEIYAA